ncbi:hypothetical protein DLH99_25400, partial [Vibrio parahaemolyticus]|nr:hypothetical protein [Vibrio parahaemolyticus]
KKALYRLSQFEFLLIFIISLRYFLERLEKILIVMGIFLTLIGLATCWLVLVLIHLSIFLGLPRDLVREKRRNENCLLFYGLFYGLLE